MISNAVFSKNRTHRYVLTRKWDSDKPSLMIIGLNPSTADEKKDDPTIRRCTGFAKKWGFGKLVMVNIFAYRATSPRNILNHKNPVGEKNDYYIKKLSKRVDKIVLAYGNHGKFKNRHDRILQIIKDPHCIKKSKTGMPAHPLYLRYTKKPIRYYSN